MKKLIVALVLCFALVGFSEATEIETKHSCLLNFQDGKTSYVTAKTIKKWEKIDFDVFCKDMDRLLGLEREFTIGVAVAYNLGKLSDYIEWVAKIPVIDILDKHTSFSIGYGAGVENLFTENCELQHGIYTGGFEIKVEF